MQKIERDPFTYVNVVCEAKLHPTEKKENIEKILGKFMFGDISTDERVDGTFLLIKGEGTEALQIFHEWVASQKIIDTVRSRLFKSIVGNVTAVYFNRQAAYMNHLSLIDLNDGTPLGPIAIQIISDNLEDIINIVAPKTYDGKILTEEQLERYLEKIERRKERKRKEREQELTRDKAFIEEYDDLEFQAME